MASPRDSDGLFRVVVFKIVLRYLYRKTEVFVAQILVFQSVRVVFRMAGYKDLPYALGEHGVNPRLLARGDDADGGNFFHVLAQDRGVAGVRRHKNVVKAAEEYRVFILHPVREDAEQLFRQVDLRNPVVVVEPRLCPPAYVESARNVRF